MYKGVFAKISAFEKVIKFKNCKELAQKQKWVVFDIKKLKNKIKFEYLVKK